MSVPGLSEGSRSLLSIDDLTDADIRSLLARAAALAASGAKKPSGAGFSAALLFLQPSLRTRLGFSEAARRLGGTAFDVPVLRYGPEMSAAESFGDTVRVVSGMVNLMVVRTACRLDRTMLAETAVCPIINGGDGAEHPSQALIDLSMIEAACGEPRALRVGVCGDLRSRAARSLLALLARHPPREVRLMAPQSRSLDDQSLLGRFGPALVCAADPSFDGLDVLYMAGLAERRDSDVLSSADRRSFALTAQGIRTLPARALVLCPLPVIDEIDPEVRGDPRLRMFEQSDRGVFVRMALIEQSLGMG